jgi:hypothetical protein
VLLRGSLLSSTTQYVECFFCFFLRLWAALDRSPLRGSALARSPSSSEGSKTEIDGGVFFGGGRTTSSSTLDWTVMVGLTVSFSLLTVASLSAEILSSLVVYEVSLRLRGLLVMSDRSTSSQGMGGGTRLSEDEWGGF